MTTVLQWLRSHSSAILATAVTMSNFHLLPKAVGELARVIAVAYGAQ